MNSEYTPDALILKMWRAACDDARMLGLSTAKGTDYRAECGRVEARAAAVYSRNLPLHGDITAGARADWIIEGARRDLDVKLRLRRAELAGGAM